MIVSFLRNTQLRHCTTSDVRRGDFTCTAWPRVVGALTRLGEEGGGREWGAPGGDMNAPVGVSCWYAAPTAWMDPTVGQELRSDLSKDAVVREGTTVWRHNLWQHACRLVCWSG